MLNSKAAFIDLLLLFIASRLSKRLQVIACTVEKSAMNEDYLHCVVVLSCLDQSCHVQLQVSSHCILALEAEV